MRSAYCRMVMLQMTLRLEKNKVPGERVILFWRTRGVTLLRTWSAQGPFCTESRVGPNLKPKFQREEVEGRVFGI